MRQTFVPGVRQFNRVSIQVRAIERALRREILLRAAPNWSGTKAALKRAINQFLKPLRKKFAFLFRAAMDRRRAALLAGVFLSGLAAPAAAIDLATIVAGSGGFVINGIAVDDRSGTSVSSAGDVNGEGLAALLSPAP